MSNKTHTYSGKDYDISYDGGLCIHAGECVRGSKAFDPEAKPWIDPDAAALEEAEAVVARCPSGALRVTRSGTSQPIEAPSENIVTVSPSGPLYVSGTLKIELPDGTEISDMRRAALCRCGLSKNKPFCDNSHVDSEFDDAGAVAESCDTADAATGPLRIKTAPDGPLLLSGELKVRAASGRDALADGRAFLCRCGHSANKPFCDGSHKEKGFTAP